MSESGEASPAESEERRAWGRLEAAIGRLLDDRALQLRRIAELEAMLGQLRDGSLNPVAQQDRLHALEGENADLHRRIREGREGVDRLLAKLRFLEEQQGLDDGSRP